MPKSDARNRLKALLANRQGAELIDAIANELATLHAQMSRISEELRLLPVYQSFSDRLGMLTDSGVGEGILPDRLRINASHLFVSENGFYGVEHDSGGIAFRWTGPRRDFSFVVYLDRRAPLRLELELANMADPKLQADTLLLVDGTNVPLEIARARNGYVGRAILPERDKTRATSLIFVVPCVLPEPKGLDPRQLGVAFRELRIQPAAPPGADSDQLATVREDELDSASGWLMSSEPVVALGGAAPLTSVERASQAARSLSSSALLPGVARIDADEIEDGARGFFQLEKDHQGRVYRWTGPGKTFTLTLPIDRSKATAIRLCLVGFVDRDRQTPLTVAVDGVTRELALSSEPDGIIAHAKLPRTSSVGPATFTFTVQAVFNPSNADRRSLGVAFRYLTVEPASRPATMMRFIGRVRRKALRILSSPGRVDLKRPAQIAP